MSHFRADLHCHSYFSDGSLSPVDVINLAKDIGLNALSITDHDSVSAYESAIPYAKEKDLELIPGVEFSSELNGVSVHILGYAFRPEHPAIQQFCQKHQERRRERNREILAKLAKINIIITEEDIEEAYKTLTNIIPYCVGRPHIALALKYKNYVTDTQEAFRQYIGENKPCFVKGSFFSAQDTIDVIHKSGGLAIIAHPHLVAPVNIMNQLLGMNFDGMECYYGRFTSDKHERWLKLAKKRNWLVTGGSDFHGALRPNIPLGCSWINEETFQPIRDHYSCNTLE